MIKVRISTSDALLKGRQLFVVDKVTDTYIQLFPFDGTGESHSLSHQELLELLQSPSVTIKYGYFSDVQAKRRAVAGRQILPMLPKAEQDTIYFKEVVCQIAEEALEAKEFALSDASYAKFRKGLGQRVQMHLRTALKSRPERGVDPNVLLHDIPCLKTLRAWLQGARTKDPMMLVNKSRFAGKNACGINPLVEAIVSEVLKDHLRPGGVEVPEVCRQANAEIANRNALNSGTDASFLKPVSESTIRRRINGMGKFEVYASRNGIAKAKHKFGAHTGGIEAQVPGERCEMDEWEMDLMAFLIKAGVDVTLPSLRDMPKGRIWVCAIIDCATRCVLAVKLAKTPNLDDALATVWMAMRSRTKLARNLGCESDWDQHVHIGELVVDNGSTLVSSAFKAALAELGVGYSVAPAGVPKLRARIERLFLSFITLLMPHLTGRTFSNPRERGEYPTESHTVHTNESIVMLLIRFVVDVYHNRKHSGMMNATPANEWKRRIAKYGWNPPQSAHELRHAFGIKWSRKLGRHGVTVCGLNYHSAALAEHFQTYGGEEIEIRIDPMDVGHVSCWIEESWQSIAALNQSVHGLSVTEWEQIVFKIRQHNDGQALLTCDVLDRAISAIKGLDASQRAIMEVGSVVVTADEIRRAEDETFWGLQFGDLDDPVPFPKGETPVFMDVSDPVFLADQIGGSDDASQTVLTPIPSAPVDTSDLFDEANSDPSNVSPKRPNWSFYNDQE